MELAEKNGADRGEAADPGVKTPGRGLEKKSSPSDSTAGGGPREPSLSKRGREALRYAAEFGWHVFPITEGTKDKPRVKWTTAATTRGATIRDWWTKWPDDNIGIATEPSGLCVFDLDKKNGKDGEFMLDLLIPEGAEIPPTAKAKTPTGGVHLYFLGRTRSSNGTIDEGVDAKSRGGYVLAPSSQTETGAYIWQVHPELRMFPVNLPTWMRALTGKVTERVAKSQAPAAELDTPEKIDRGRDWLVRAAPLAVEGKHGDDTTVTVAARLKDIGLSKPEALDAMLEVWNPRCEPPWEPEELSRKVANAYRYCVAKRPGEDAPEADFPDDAPPLSATAPKLERTQNGRPRDSLGNCLALVTHAGLGLAFDELAQRPVLRAETLPWETNVGRELNDDLVRVIRHFLLVQHRAEFSKEMVTEACLTLAREAPFNPVVEYLAGLSWDGTHRLDRWLVDYLGAEDSAFVHAAGRKTLIGAVRRARRPGCKFDTVLILQGHQGSGKSKAVATLAGSWFSDAELGRIDSKEAPMLLQNAWIHELGELTAMRRAEVEALKAFVSRCDDRFRAPYERLPRTASRRCIFVGTTNSNAYLRDLTGNRRFWPIATGPIDLEALRRDRDQLWAEAAVAEAAGEPLELPADLWSEAAEHQAHRLVEDPWEEKIKMWLDANKADRVHTRTLLRDVLILDAGRENQVNAKRLREVMSKLGWAYKRGLRIKDQEGSGYVSPDERRC